MEKILEIKDEGFSLEKGEGRSYPDHFNGFQIVTDRQTIKLGISSSQSCCEQSGYFITNDNIEEFIGADLLSVSTTDTALNTKKLEAELEYGVDKGGIMYVNLETSKGTLQFTAYNSHNGYYGHEAVVMSEQLNTSMDL